MSDLAMKVIQWQANGRVGVSSATMASIALGLKRNIYGSGFDAPSDPSDLKRCMLLVEEIPEIKDFFPVIADKCKQFAPIINEWDSLISLLKKEMNSGTGKAPETYKRMKELLGHSSGVRIVFGQ